LALPPPHFGRCEETANDGPPICPLKEASVDASLTFPFLVLSARQILFLFFLVIQAFPCRFSALTPPRAARSPFSFFNRARRGLGLPRHRFLSRSTFQAVPFFLLASCCGALCLIPCNLPWPFTVAPSLRVAFFEALARNDPSDCFLLSKQCENLSTSPGLIPFDLAEKLVS